jgi:hypothetical protein
MRQALLPAITTVATALLIGCSDQPTSPEYGVDATATPISAAPAAARKVVLHFPLEGPFPLAFTSPCTGESVEGTGEIVGQVNVVGELVDENLILGLHITEHGTVRGTVTDQSTGTTYTFHNSYHSGFNTPSGPAPNFNTTFSGTLVARPITGEGGALLIHVTIHTTVNANGVESTTVEADEFRCLG